MIFFENRAHSSGSCARSLAVLAPLRAVACFIAAVSVQTPARAQDNPSSSIDVTRLFSTSCGFCHQAGGRVKGRGPKLMGSERSDEQITKQIKDGKPPGMPAFGKAFSDDQISAIVAYIRALK
jgi:mono/diheme cytochrome c family protein